ncbi:MAG: replication-associated recombination protein A [Acidobacteriota bacterium]
MSDHRQRSLLSDDAREPSSERSASSPAADAAAPLPERMRPRRLEEVVGQSEILGEDGFLARAIREDRVPSLIFWGPPGTGKTTLARIIARETHSHFLPFSAVVSGIREIKDVMSKAEKLGGGGRRVLLFVDEIHRFNKAQQDAFLPYVEAGTVVLVGATTENPSFELNSALLSRCRVVVLEPLQQDDLLEVLRRALRDPERGLGVAGLEVEDEALQSIAQLGSGDARRVLNLLETVVADVGGGTVTAEAVARSAQRKVLVYDKSGEEHFNLISALHKSLRESDADASVYWLLRMLEAGEDPRYVARRLVRFASEDVGLADPAALPQALAGWDAYLRLGSPEGDLALVQVAVYLALAPKSIGIYRAEKEVRRAIRERPADPVPLQIRNAPTDLMKELDYGSGYRYAPDLEEGVGGLQCLPDGLAGTKFYEPSGHGFEAELAERMADLERRRERSRADVSEPDRRSRSALPQKPRRPRADRPE